MKKKLYICVFLRFVLVVVACRYFRQEVMDSAEVQYAET